MPAIAIPAAIGLGGQIINAITGHRAATGASNIQSTAATEAANASLAAGQGAATGVTEAAGRATTGINEATRAAIEAAQQGTQQGNATLQGTLERQRANLNPYLEAGRTGVEGLTREAGTNQDFSFNTQDFENDPSRAIILREATDAITRSAAARGLGPGSGGVLKALARENVAQLSKTYGDVYRRSENTFRQNQQGRQGLLSGLAGLGQTATGQLNTAEGQAGSAISGNQVDLGRLTGEYGTTGARNIAEIDTTAAARSGEFLTEAQRNANDARLQGANARASGVIGRANAIGGLVSGIANTGVDASTAYYANDSARQRRMAQRLPVGVR